MEHTLSVWPGEKHCPLFARRLAVTAAIMLGFTVVAGKLMFLAVKGHGEIRRVMADSSPPSAARPDIMDRGGRLLASDVEVPSLAAKPALVLDIDEAAERLHRVLPDLDPVELRKALSEPGRRFVWIRRHLAPHVAQRIHDLGLPGLEFYTEFRRTYPADYLAGNVLGGVNIDNRGVAGVERHIDAVLAKQTGAGAGNGGRPSVRLSLDLGVQHGLEQELAAALARYRAQGTAGLILDVNTGEVLAAASLPATDPSRRSHRLDKLAGGTYELGSVFKAVTVAMALESEQANLETVYDVRQPLTAGRYTIRDLHPQRRPLTMREIFVHSSNIGAAMLAREAGKDRQRAFLDRLGLLEPLSTEAGPVAPPALPQSWGETETLTIGYGHGIALAPLQFAAAAAALVNGGSKIVPTFLAGVQAGERPRVIAPETSRRIVELMRQCVTDPRGTGRRAEVAGLNVGGKTGTAEIAGVGGYKRTAVISSFLGIFPTDAPRYLVFVLLYEPQPSRESQGQITGGTNAAPTVASVVARVAPLLGVLPQNLP